MSWNTIRELFIPDEGKLQIEKYERESPGILALSLRVNRKLDPGGGIRALLSTPSAKTYEVLEDDGTPVRFTSREWRYYWTRPTGEELVGEEWERRKLKMYKRLSRERFEDGFGFFELRGLLESDLEFMYFGGLVILIRCTRNVIRLWINSKTLFGRISHFEIRFQISIKRFVTLLFDSLFFPKLINPFHIFQTII